MLFPPLLRLLHRKCSAVSIIKALYLLSGFARMVCFLSFPGKYSLKKLFETRLMLYGLALFCSCI